MKIKYICYTSFVGYARAASHNINAFRNNGIDIVIDPLDAGYTRSIEYLDVGKDFSNVDISIFHCIPNIAKKHIFRAEENSIKIGYATFEASKAPIEWIDILNEYFDLILAPSQFCMQSFHGVNSLYYLPHCIDLSLFSPYGENIPFNNNIMPRSFNFLYICSPYERKNIENLVVGFLDEFKNEEVTLTIKTNDKNRSYFKNIDKYLFKNRVFFHFKTLPQKIMPNFIRSFDCYIHPSLGEGFGLPILEAMACGVPVIATNYSGCTECVNSETSIVLEPEGFEDKGTIDNLYQFRDQKWPIISSEQIAKKMRRAYEDDMKLQSISKKARKFIELKFSYEKIFEMFKNILQKEKNKGSVYI